MTVADSRSAQVHRALSSPVRVRLLEALRGEAQDAWALAEHSGLHVNTVRGHLTVLEDAGLVRSDPESRDRPGRPRLIYRVEPDADGGDDGYRLLAEVLASCLETVEDDPSGRAEHAGTAWGGYLVERVPPSRPIDAEAALQRVLDLLDELGFDPLLSGDGDGRRLVLRRCPFLEVAEGHQDVVCGIHLGIMRGALAVLDAGVEVADLLPFAEPDSCVSHLEVTA